MKVGILKVKLKEILDRIECLDDEIEVSQTLEGVNVNLNQEYSLLPNGEIIIEYTTKEGYFFCRTVLD